MLAMAPQPGQHTSTVTADPLLPWTDVQHSPVGVPCHNCVTSVKGLWFIVVTTLGVVGFAATADLFEYKKDLADTVGPKSFRL